MSFYSMIGLGVAVNMASTAPSVPAIVGPLANDLSALSGFPLKTVLMTQVIAYSTVILPYQVPPLVVAMHLGGVSMRDGAKMTLALAIVSVIILIPLNYMWWGSIGLLP
jgi:di/tricarboxylate transporter